MSLRGVAMLYERIMATRCSTGRPRDHNTYVASIFIGRDIRLPFPPRTFLPEQKARAPRPGDARLALPDRRVRFPSRSSPLVYSFTYAHGREHMFTNNVISTRVYSRKANKPRRSRLRDSTARPIHPRFSIPPFVLIAFKLRRLEIYRCENLYYRLRCTVTFFVIMLNKIVVLQFDRRNRITYDKGSSSHYRDVIKDEREFGRSALSANVRFLSKRQWSLGLSMDDSLSLTVNSLLSRDKDRP